MLRTGCPWESLPRGFGASGTACRRRLRDWQAAGVRAALQRTLLESPGREGGLDGSKAIAD